MSEINCSIPLSKGLVSKVDPDDYLVLSRCNWCASDSGNGIHYAQRKDRKKTVLMHRFIMGVTDPNIFVDHINGDTLDNRRSNLRLCSRSQNNRNKTAHKNSTSKYLGVCWDKARSKWKSTIYVGNKVRHLGRFKNEVDAAHAYDKAARSEFGEFANLNFK